MTTETRDCIQAAWEHFMAMREGHEQADSVEDPAFTDQEQDSWVIFKSEVTEAIQMMDRETQP